MAGPKFIQIAASDSPASDGVREGGPLLYALDEFGGILSFYRGHLDETGTIVDRGWSRMPDKRLEP
jgi:hypothetical protein